MKLKEVIGLDIDVDVYGCYDVIAYCGAKLTEEGYEYYKEFMDYECKLTNTELLITDKRVNDELGDNSRRLYDMFLGMAGYLGETFSDKMFIF